MTIKNQQIKQSNERTRESNILMKELQSLLATAQQRALLPVPPTSDKVGMFSPVDVFDDDKADEHIPAKATSDASPKPGSASKQKQQRSRPKSKSTKAPRKSKPTKSKPKWHEMPTFRKLLSRQQD